MRDPFRQNPEAIFMQKQGANHRRRRAALDGARSLRPRDAVERAEVFAAHQRYAAAHGAHELHGVLCLEAARYAPEITTPLEDAVAAAEQVFDLQATRRRVGR